VTACHRSYTARGETISLVEMFSLADINVFSEAKHKRLVEEVILRSLFQFINTMF